TGLARRAAIGIFAPCTAAGPRPVQSPTRPARSLENGVPAVGQRTEGCAGRSVPGGPAPGTYPERHAHVATEPAHHGRRRDPRWPPHGHGLPAAELVADGDPRVRAARRRDASRL